MLCPNFESTFKWRYCITDITFYPSKLMQNLICCCDMIKHWFVKIKEGWVKQCTIGKLGVVSRLYFAKE